MAGSAPDEGPQFVGPAFSRHSSVVEHVIGNDGVGSSILPGGTIPSPMFGGEPVTGVRVILN
jgi:hypothetical protein